MNLRRVSNNTSNFGASWSSYLNRVVKPIREKDPYLFKQIRNIEKGKEIGLSGAWIVLRGKGTKEYLFPRSYDYVRDKHFGIDLITVKTILKCLQKKHD